MPDELARPAASGRLSDRALLEQALFRKVPVSPLRLEGEISGMGARLHGIAAGRVETLNHIAVAYAKLWENVSANQYFFRALEYIWEIGDEYGMVDQLFLIGQVMLRRRDFRAAALWYLAALKKIRLIHEFADRGQPRTGGLLASQTQTGADWQTQAVASGTEAQICAALGDVWAATGGTAFLSAEEIEGIWVQNKGNAETYREMRKQAWTKTGNILRWLFGEVSDDRSDEFFFTHANSLFLAIGDHYNANDVALRLLEERAELVHQSSAALDLSTNEPDEFQKYAFLNAWRLFWRGARILLLRAFDRWKNDCAHQ